MKIFLILALFVVSTLDGYTTSYYISPNSGDDNNPGQRNSPFQTINKAVSIIKNGDRIILMAGDYFESITLNQVDNVTISAFGDGEAILYGSHSDFVSNGDYPWKLLRKEKNRYWKNEQYIYVGPLPKVSRKYKLPDYYDQFNYIFDKNGGQLYGYRHKKNFFKRDKQNTNGEGYWFSKDSVYVAVNNPYDERYQSLYISRTGSTIRNLGCKRLVIDGGSKNQIKLKYSGRYAYSAEGEIGGSAIKNVDFEDCVLGVYLFGVGGDKFEIDKCNFTYRTDPNLIWQDIKASFLESSGIAYANGTLGSFTIRNSHFEGVFNGIIVLPGKTVISNNMFVDIGDDAIELDGDAIDIQVNDNYFIDCFTAFSLCPVEKGPVYIFNNTIYSQKKDYPFEILKDGSVRKILPKTLKFWNLPNGSVLKDGKKQRVSGNVHFYYNTVISKDQPFSIGGYNNKAGSPINSTFYNNIFYSEGILTYSTGFSEDGIDVDNNLFYSSFKNKKEPRMFIGWNGANHHKRLKNDASWTGNIFKKIEFKSIERIQNFPEDSPFVICEKDKKKVENSFTSKKLPSHYPEAKILNQRRLPGANQ